MTQRVLCADDEELIRDALAFFFEHLGLEARCCANGRECLEEFEKSSRAYDLVLVNYDMPGMNGVEVARKLRSIAPRQRICLTSAYPSTVVFKGVAKTEVGELLPKPYSLGKLRRFLLRNLEVSEAHAHVVTSLAGRSSGGGAWLKALREAVQAGRLQMHLHTEAETAISQALEGFPNVVVWDVETVQPRVPELEQLGAEGIPVVFAGPLPEGHGLERFGLVLERHAPGREVVEVVRQAAFGTEG